MLLNYWNINLLWDISSKYFIFFKGFGWQKHLRILALYKQKWIQMKTLNAPNLPRSTHNQCLVTCIIICFILKLTLNCFRGAFPLSNSKAWFTNLFTHIYIYIYILAACVLQVNDALLYHPKEAQNPFHWLFHLLFLSGGMTSNSIPAAESLPSSRNS